MPKKKTVTVEDIQHLNQETAKTREAVEVALEVKTSFDVYNSSGGYVRTYSLEDHGPDAEKLAHQFAGKISGSVK